MENSASPTGYRFGPDRRLTALCAAGAVVGAILTIATTDKAGKIMFAAAAALLAVYVVTDLLFWPRVTATADGLRINSPTVRGRFEWSQVDCVRASSRQRAGLRVVTLEIDVAEQLVVFSRRALGADPEVVEQALHAWTRAD